MAAGAPRRETRLAGAARPHTERGALLVVPWLWASEAAVPKRLLGQRGRRVMTLPTTRVNVNGFLVSDALLDSGSQLSLLDSRVFSVIAPNAELTAPARLLSATGHHLNAVGKCVLSVLIADGRTKDTEFTVVHNIICLTTLCWGGTLCRRMELF